MTVLRLLPALLAVVACSPDPTHESAETATTDVPQPTIEENKREIRSYLDLEALFDELGYTPEAWQAGIREIPRLYVSEIPERWSKHTVQEIDVLTKKRLFFRTLAPLVLRSNELILQDRKRLVGLGTQLARGGELDSTDLAWLSELATRDRLDAAEFTDTAALIAELTPRVDVIPLSLALSQAAEESGWGTSRFAFGGNALFGQWTWGEGIRPESQRSGRGDYKIAAFESPLQSVQVHARNLNGHPAYRDFRQARAEARQAMKPVRGFDLAASLTRYSERGADYVKTLRSIMRANKLDVADEAYLASMPPITLVPVDE